MPKTLRNTILALAFAGALGAQTVEEWPRTGLQASIPFAFSVKGVSLPPGEYKFAAPTNTGIVSITDSGGRRVMILTRPTAPPRLFFEKRGSGYILMNW